MDTPFVTMEEQPTELICYLLCLPIAVCMDEDHLQDIPSHRLHR